MNGIKETVSGSPVSPRTGRAQAMNRQQGLAISAASAPSVPSRMPLHAQHSIWHAHQTAATCFPLLPQVTEVSRWAEGPGSLPPLALSPGCFLTVPARRKVEAPAGGRKAGPPAVRARPHERARQLLRQARPVGELVPGDQLSRRRLGPLPQQAAAARRARQRQPAAPHGAEPACLSNQDDNSGHSRRSIVSRPRPQQAAVGHHTEQRPPALPDSATRSARSLICGFTM